MKVWEVNEIIEFLRDKIGGRKYIKYKVRMDRVVLSLLSIDGNVLEEIYIEEDSLEDYLRSIKFELGNAADSLGKWFEVREGELNV